MVHLQLTQCYVSIVTRLKKKMTYCLDQLLKMTRAETGRADSAKHQNEGL